MRGEGYDFSLTHFDTNDGFSEYNFGKFNGKLGFFLTKNLFIPLGYDNFTYKTLTIEWLRLIKKLRKVALVRAMDKTKM